MPIVKAGLASAGYSSILYVQCPRGQSGVFLHYEANKHNMSDAERLKYMEDMATLRRDIEARVRYSRAESTLQSDPGLLGLDQCKNDRLEAKLFSQMD